MRWKKLRISHGYFQSRTRVLIYIHTQAQRHAYASSLRLGKKSNGTYVSRHRGIGSRRECKTRARARDTTGDKRGDSRVAGCTRRENIIETFLLSGSHSFSPNGEGGGGRRRGEVDISDERVSPLHDIMYTHPRVTAYMRRTGFAYFRKLVGKFRGACITRLIMHTHTMDTFTPLQ